MRGKFYFIVYLLIDEEINCNIKDCFVFDLIELGNGL